MTDETLQHTAFDGVTDYIEALDTICGKAQRTLHIFENTYEHIGFNSETRYNLLHRFLLGSPTHHLQILAHDPQYLVRYCPRIMTLLRDFGHSMAIYQTPPHLHKVTDPFAVADNNHYVRRFHFDDTRGMLALNDPEGARQLNAQFQEMWLSSHPGASATKLGL